MDVEIAAPAADALGEGPVWLPASRELLRVDIGEPAIVLRDHGTGQERRRRVEAPVGFALPARGGGLIAGVGRTLTRFPALDEPPRRIAGVGRALDAPGLRFADAEPERAGNRFNDAACDPAGRLWAGTMSTTREPGSAALYRVLASGEVTVALAGVTVSNGLDWNRDATRLYYIDSITQRIDAIGFDADRGRLGARRPFAAVDPAHGLPDGLCVDAEDGIWVALFGGGAIRRYLPDGRLEAHIPLPVTHPTSLAFGGPALTDLYVTSARRGIPDHAGSARGERPRGRGSAAAGGSLLLLRPGVAGRLTGEFG